MDKMKIKVIFLFTNTRFYFISHPRFTKPRADVQLSVFVHKQQRYAARLARVNILHMKYEYGVWQSIIAHTSTIFNIVHRDLWLRRHPSHWENFLLLLLVLAPVLRPIIINYINKWLDVACANFHVICYLPASPVSVISDCTLYAVLVFILFSSFVQIYMSEANVQITKLMLMQR